MSVACPHGERCGGCALLGLERAAQLEHKQARVRTALARYETLREPEAETITGAEPDVGYRTRAKLVVSARGEVGLYARGSHDVVDIPGCRVISTSVAGVVDAVRARVGGRDLGLRSLDVREARDGDETVVLVTLGGDAAHRPELEALGRELATRPEVAGVAVSERAKNERRVVGAASTRIAGVDAARDRLAPESPYQLATYGGFVQAHRGQAAAIARRALAELERRLGGLRGARVLELYAGAGAFGLWLAARGARCVLNEQYGAALAWVEQAAREQDLRGIALREGDAAEVCVALERAGERFDAVIVNPPRRGLPARLRTALARLRPRVLLYVSCEPETLARDLAGLRTLGLVPRLIAPYDMMPQSLAVETLTVLEPSPPPRVRVLYEDDALLAVDKPPHLPTIPESEQPSSLLDQLKREHALPELAPVHRLDLGTSGVCLFAKRRDAVAGLASALAAGEKRYLALVRGIPRPKGTIDRPLRERGARLAAKTRYKRFEVLGGHALLGVRPEQGRTHQVRRHLASIGHAVLGDARYGDGASNRHFEHEHGLDRTFLHLQRVVLRRPSTTEELVLTSELAPDLAAVVERLRAKGATH